MFRKREKRHFPPGTFIPLPARIAAIIHLCLAFILLLWIGSMPFLGDFFAIKSEMLLYESVLKNPLMENLPETKRQNLQQGYHQLQEELQLSFTQKLKSAFRLLCIDTPPLEQAWLLFSLIIPILLLIRIEGAPQACILLPVIALAYAVDCRMHAPQENLRDLFPSEQYIVENYVGRPLSSSISKQKAELTKGWHDYLVLEWGLEQPENDPVLFAKQVQKGEFAFNIFRLQEHQGTIILKSKQKPARQSLGILGLYVLWNSFFAGIAMIYCRQSRSCLIY